jgi:hypothetical protein
MQEPNNGSLMIGQRLSRVNNGVIGLLTFKETVVQPIYNAIPLTQDGGRSLDTRTTSLSTPRPRLLLSQVDSITRTETLSLNQELERSIKSGESFTLTSTRRSQPRVNSTRSLDFTLKETSMLFHNYQIIDTLT